MSRNRKLLALARGGGHFRLRSFLVTSGEILNNSRSLGSTITSLGMTGGYIISLGMTGGYITSLGMTEGVMFSLGMTGDWILDESK
ncbi:hypothetical protein A2239_00360 [Candidatus Uhrbacteria bacterium RIFOXYA2_FULL_40_9]|nr:MAG: hypothetical protein A2239_00360 [Candidatus Uhrbacteria bacterium RIFOXYA2_FULL_40_9]OGL98145.1 MAG: hypothetical protein A2332_02935 [Candidatus Uhrbacteria bacterium RIFOXYB2_FULL_41_18]